jgi:hypothetical protein
VTNSINSPISKGKNLYIEEKKSYTVIIIIEWDSKKKIMYNFTRENVYCWYKQHVQLCYFDREW